MIPFNLSDFMASGAFVCGTTQSGKTNNAKHLVDYMIRKGVLIHILDASQAWNELGSLINITKIPHDFTEVEVDISKSQIYDMSELSHKQRISIANQVCKALYYKHVVEGFREPEAVVFEECQTYVPNGCLRSFEKYEPIINLITIGGNFNLRYLAVTQFPAMVDKAVVKAAQQRYFGLTSEKNDVNYIKGFISDMENRKLREDIGVPFDKKDKRFITHFLKRGQFVYQTRGQTHIFQSGKYKPEPLSNVQNSYNIRMNFSVPAMVPTF